MKTIKISIFVSIILFIAALPWVVVHADDTPPPTSPWDAVRGWVSQSPNRALYIHYNGGYATADDVPVAGAIIADTYVPEDPIDHMTAVTGVLHSDAGPGYDHTAVSGIGVNRSTGGVWGGHFQCKNLTTDGYCFGVEVNVESSGPEPREYWKTQNLGMDIIGRGYEGATNPEVGTLLRLRSSEDLDVADPAHVRTGLKINGDIKHPIYIHTEHETAMVMQPGQKMCLDGATCKHYIRVNPKTGRTEIR